MRIAPCPGKSTCTPRTILGSFSNLNWMGDTDRSPLALRFGSGTSLLSRATTRAVRSKLFHCVAERLRLSDRPTHTRRLFRQMCRAPNMWQHAGEKGLQETERQTKEIQRSRASQRSASARAFRSSGGYLETREARPSAVRRPRPKTRAREARGLWVGTGPN